MANWNGTTAPVAIPKIMFTISMMALAGTFNRSAGAPRANSTAAEVEAPAGNALYSTSFRTFDGFGNQTSVTDPRGVVITNLFDALGRVLQRQVLETNGSVLTTEKFAYEPGGQVTATTNALGGTNQILFTQTGKPFRSVGFDGATNGWTYYLDGRPKRQYLANGSYWQTTYNDVSLLATRTFYSGAGVALATNVSGFDRRGNQILRVDELGNSFTNAFDGLNRVKFTTGPVISGSPSVQQVLTSYYDAAGLAATNVNALGEKTITLFDVLGRVIDTEIHDVANNFGPHHHHRLFPRPPKRDRHTRQRVLRHCQDHLHGQRGQARSHHLLSLPGHRGVHFGHLRSG